MRPVYLQQDDGMGFWPGMGIGAAATLPTYYLGKKMIKSFGGVDAGGVNQYAAPFKNALDSEGSNFLSEYLGKKNQGMLDAEVALKNLHATENASSIDIFNAETNLNKLRQQHTTAATDATRKHLQSLQGNAPEGVSKKMFGGFVDDATNKALKSTKGGTVSVPYSAPGSAAPSGGFFKNMGMGKKLLGGAAIAAGGYGLYHNKDSIWDYLTKSKARPKKSAFEQYKVPAMGAAAGGIGSYLLAKKYMPENAEILGLLGAGAGGLLAHQASQPKRAAGNFVSDYVEPDSKEDIQLHQQALGNAVESLIGVTPDQVHQAALKVPVNEGPQENLALQNLTTSAQSRAIGETLKHTSQGSRLLKAIAIAKMLKR